MDFDAVDALLASVTIDDGLPPPAERRELRRKARLSQAQVAQAVGVTRETVSAWEAGRWEPTGDARIKYRRLMDGLKAKLGDAPPTSPTTPAEHPSDSDPDRLAHPAPCVLCGAPATHHVEGYPQHLHPADCAHTPQPPAAPHPLPPQLPPPHSPTGAPHPLTGARPGPGAASRN
ncbi:helix-turn-helix transcriptional regulator [Streptomyces lasalocidi]